MLRRKELKAPKPTEVWDCRTGDWDAIFFSVGMLISFLQLSPITNEQNYNTPPKKYTKLKQQIRAQNNLKPQTPLQNQISDTLKRTRVGLMDRPDSPDGELIKYRWDDPHVIPANMTVEVSELFTRELTRGNNHMKLLLENWRKELGSYIEETEELAMKGLRDNRHILDIITKQLLEKSRITGLEVEEIMKGLSPIMFEDFVKSFQIDLKEDGPLPHNDKLRYQPLDVCAAPLHR